MFKNTGPAIKKEKKRGGGGGVTIQGKYG